RADWHSRVRAPDLADTVGLMVKNGLLFFAWLASLRPMKPKDNAPGPFFSMLVSARSNLRRPFLETLVRAGVWLFAAIGIGLLTETSLLAQPGSLDHTFAPVPLSSGQINDFDVQSDGRIIIAGTFTNYGGIPRAGLARLNSDGSLDTSFDPGTAPNNGITIVRAIQGGKIAIAGWFNSVQGVPRRGIAKLNADGTLDAGFVPV